MSMNEKVQVEIAKRRLEVEIEGLMPMEISGIAEMVNEKYNEVQALYPKIVDTSKLAVYTALYMGIELYKIRQAQKTDRSLLDNSLDHIGRTLQETLAAVESRTGGE